MDEKRLLLALALSVIVFVAWQFFFAEQPSVQKPAKEQQQETQAQEQPVSTSPSEKEIKEETVTGVSDTPADTTDDVQSPQKIANTITVDTPLYRAEISEKGAVFYSFVLKNYREQSGEDAPLKELLADDGSIQTMSLGFKGNSIPGLEKAVYSTEPAMDTFTVNDSATTVTFYWKSANGVTVEKAFNFSPDSYVVGLVVTVKNASNQTIQDRLTLTLNGMVPKDTRMYGFEGPSTLIGEKLEEVEVKDIAENNIHNGKLKWVAMQDRYFMSSIIPDIVAEASMQLALKPTDIVESTYVQAEESIRPGTQQHYDFHLFFGPKSMQILNGVGHNLNKALDFGWFTILAKPCLWLMNALYSFIPNYGIAIIILTLLIKIVLWPLGAKSYKSMSEMKKIQPLMKEIREKYKDDRKKMNEEVMALYRTYKINPLGGCLPMVVQIPVFFALYRMLYQAIELRHAPFFLWIDDLSAPDRLFHFGFSIPFMEPPYGIPVLTIVMGATMILQQKMSPPMGDPMQAKMMMLMPVVFTVIFINFSSGLVLYWLVNNVLSISQQYYIQRKYA
jgi:YidC/Oxa1 family membrane protein insertase